MEKIVEKEREVPVVWKGDILVAGGGVAGVGAAITAAKNGAKTLLVEQQGCLGGLVTLGMVSLPLSYVEGIGREFFDRLTACGGLEGRFADPEKVKYILERMVLEAGVKILYFTYVIDSIVEDHTIKGVIIHNKSGRQAILAKRVIDASGDGDVAVYAGCPYEKGSPDHKGYNEASSLQFRVGNVDWEKYLKSHKSPGWQKELQEAVDKGDLPYLIDKYVNWMIKMPGRKEGKDEVTICLAHSRNSDCTSAEDITRQMIEQREQVQHLMKFLRKYIPGFEKCWLIDTSPLLGIRESRRIIGEYIFTGDDIVSGKKFADGVVRDTHGMDIHHPTDVGHIKHMTHLKSDGTKEEKRLQPGDYYTIPYRCFIPQKIENLLIAGRCISSTFEGQSGTRLIMTCLNMGQVAGTASAQSIKENISPRKLDVSLLRKQLIKQGMSLDKKPPLYVTGSPREKPLTGRVTVNMSDALVVDDKETPTPGGAVGTDLE